MNYRLPILKMFHPVLILLGLLTLTASAQDYSLYMAGLNTYGQLGTGESGYGTGKDAFTLIPIPDGESVAHASSGNHTLIATVEGNLYTAGRNWYGELGIGESGIGNQKDTFTRIPIPDDKRVVKVDVGGDSSFFITEDGILYGAGNNSFGQLGLGDNVDRDTFTPITLPDGKKVAQVSTSGSHTLVLTREGELYVTGYNEYGELGTGESGLATNKNTFTSVTVQGNKKVVQISAGGIHSMVLTADGEVFTTGSNMSGQLGTGESYGSNNDIFTLISIPGGKKAEQISAGGFHSMVLTDDEKLYATGGNYYGQLGVGRSGSLSGENTLTLISIPGDKKVSLISAGGSESLIVTSDGGLYFAGYNFVGFENIFGYGSGDLNWTTFEKIKIDSDLLISYIAEDYVMIGRYPIDATRIYEIYSNTVSYRYYPLNQEGLLPEPFAWKVVGSLPDGFVIRDGILQGVVSQKGTYSFSVVLTSGVDQVVLDFVVHGVDPTLQPVFTGVYLGGKYTPIMIIEGSTHATPAVTELYNAVVSAGVPLEMLFEWDYIKGEAVYSIVGGALPEGLTLNAETGVISGAPTTPGEYIFVVSVKDWRGRAYQWVRLVVE